METTIFINFYIYKQKKFTFFSSINHKYLSLLFITFAIIFRLFSFFSQICFLLSVNTTKKTKISEGKREIPL